MAPAWGQDLAFFHQIVHSAAEGGAWASPLLLEPQGFFAMVHTHLVLPLVVATYALIPRQEVLLLWQALFASLALWPALRLGETVGGRPMAICAVAALAAFGPFQAAATADFRPSVLFLPGVLGVFAAARRDDLRAVLAWSLVAALGRQEAVYLLGACAACLVVIPWGGRRRRIGLVLGSLAVGIGGLWVLVKPTFFFHFDPLHLPPRVEIPPDVMERRWEFARRLALSGWGLGVLAPAALVSALPVFWQMIETGREWHVLVGPSGHYPAFWLGGVAAAGIVGAARMGRWGGPALVVLSALSFPWIGPRQGRPELRDLTRYVTEEDRVAADYDTIHAFAGRAILWNVAQLDLPDSERPYGWKRAWPITPDEVDVIVSTRSPDGRGAPADWEAVGAAGEHRVFRRKIANSSAGKPAERGVKRPAQVSESPPLAPPAPPR